MREVKFRGRYKYDNAQWVYGLPFYDKQGQISIIAAYAPDNDAAFPPKHIRFIDVDPQTVGQFTGLKDRNKKEIYEGDIVATDIGPEFIRSIVRIGEARTDGSDNCYAEDYYGVYLDGSVGLMDMLLQGKMCVIGDIYENPELLPEVKQQ